ncbi:hypothetical protein ACOIEU_002541 [Cronobacter sakazakii]
MSTISNERLEKLSLQRDELLAALEDIIAYNVQYATDKYGDASKAETMACVRRCREAIARAATLSQSPPVDETDTTSQQFESLAGKAVGEDASSMADAHMAWLNTNFPRNAYSDEEWEEVSLYTWLAWRDSQRNACFPGT